LEESTAEEMTTISIPPAHIRVYDDDNQLSRDLIAGKLDDAVADSPRPELVGRFFPSSVVFRAIPPLAPFQLPSPFAGQHGFRQLLELLDCRPHREWPARRPMQLLVQDDGLGQRFVSSLSAFRAAEESGCGIRLGAAEPRPFDFEPQDS
jgi:hypothetical protein